MEEIIKELNKLGFKGKVSSGSVGYNGNMKDYVIIEFPKKGNAKLIKQLINLGWKKEWEFKFNPALETIYSGYSIYISFKKFLNDSSQY